MRCNEFGSAPSRGSAYPILPSGDIDKVERTAEKRHTFLPKKKENPRGELERGSLEKKN